MSSELLKLAVEANPACKEVYTGSWRYNCAAWTFEELELFAELVVKDYARQRPSVELDWEN